ncbi:hypothetical protein JOD82_001958 [Paenibacillus sp. 1182]|nr:hypothetical protein [Paenibacillus sp. 1182]MBP1308938.1 hypothetical protein [Paenibacillus sp. 1182]
MINYIMIILAALLFVGVGTVDRYMLIEQFEPNILSYTKVR